MQRNNESILSNQHWWQQTQPSLISKPCSRVQLMQDPGSLNKYSISESFWSESSLRVQGEEKCLINFI